LEKHIDVGIQWLARTAMAHGREHVVRIANHVDKLQFNADPVSRELEEARIKIEAPRRGRALLVAQNLQLFESPLPLIWDAIGIAMVAAARGSHFSGIFQQQVKHLALAKPPLK
jgi:hypothetical protein